MDLFEICDDLQSGMNVLFNCLSSKNQSATMRYMIETSIVAIMNIIGKKLIKYKEQMISVYEILLVVHSRISSNTCKNINKVLCALYSKSMSKDPVEISLQEVLQYCSDKWGTGSSTLMFHKRGIISLKRKAENQGRIQPM